MSLRPTVSSNSPILISEFYQGKSSVPSIPAHQIAVDVLYAAIISRFQLSLNDFGMFNPKFKFSAPLHDCSSNLHFYSGPYRFKLVCYYLVQYEIDNGKVKSTCGHAVNQSSNLGCDC